MSHVQGALHGSRRHDQLERNPELVHRKAGETSLHNSQIDVARKSSSSPPVTRSVASPSTWCASLGRELEHLGERRAVDPNVEPHPPPSFRRRSTPEESARNARRQVAAQRLEPPRRGRFHDDAAELAQRITAAPAQVANLNAAMRQMPFAEPASTSRTLASIARVRSAGSPG